MVRIFDAEGTVMGRLASTAAKALLAGESVVIVNAEKAVITGVPNYIIGQYAAARDLGSARKGPYVPRRPDRLLRRAVRGMLPRKEPRGRAAYHRLQVHVGVPNELRTAGAMAERLVTRRGTARFILLGDLSKALGAEF